MFNFAPPPPPPHMEQQQRVADLAYLGHPKEQVPLKVSVNKKEGNKILHTDYKQKSEIGY